MPAYHSAFLCGEHVRIKPASELRRYTMPDWKYHHPLQGEQLAFAGQSMNIVGVSYWHGGGVLLRLREAPGFWHEECVEDSLLHLIDWEGYPNPAEYFRIEAEVDNGREYLSVRTPDGVECLRKYSFRAEDAAEEMRQVAAVRHFRGFLDRYQFYCPFQLSHEQVERNRDKQFRVLLNVPLDAPLPNDCISSEVLAVLREGIRDYPVSSEHARFCFEAAQWPVWERQVSNPEWMDQDRIIQTWCRFYATADDQQRESLRQIGSHTAYVVFAHRSAVRALRTGNPDWLELALLALSLNDLRDSFSRGLDYHMGSRSGATFRMLEIVARVAGAIGTDFPNMLDRVKAISSPYTAEVLSSKLDYPDRSIQFYEDPNGKMIGWP